MVGPVIQLRGVHKSYPSPSAGPAVHVLRGVDLTVPPGDALAVVGPSGSGKSTLLAIMGGLDVADAGDVLLDGRELASLCERERAGIRALQIGFVFQLHHLLPQCSVWENVLIPTLAARSARGTPDDGRARTEDDDARARRLIDRVGLGAVVDHRPSQLSGGECLRAAVARALINRPALLLADEPTGSLDEATAAEIARLLIDVNAEEGTSLVVVTHSAALAGMMRRRCVLRGGVLAE